jgi:hypothetical protein
MSYKFVLPPILVTGHHHSGTTLIGAHIASTRNCSLIWEPLNPVTSHYRFPYSKNDWFLDPFALDDDQFARFTTAFFKATSFSPVQLRYSDVLDIKEFLKYTKYSVQSIYASLSKMRPIVKDPISLFAIDFYKSQGFGIIVVIKRPWSFVVSELSRGNKPPWRDIYKRLRKTRWGSDIESLLENSLNDTLPMDVQHALFWYCSVVSSNLVDYDTTFSSTLCLVKLEDYMKNVPLYFDLICQAYNLDPTVFSQRLIAGHDLTMVQRIDGLMRNYFFPSYVGRGAKRSTVHSPEYSPSVDYCEFSDKHLTPLLSSLDWG